MTTKRLLSSGLLALAMLVTSDCVWAGTATPESILVVPARQRTVKLAFELAHCKDIGLVSYNTSPSLATPLLHVWNGQEWIQISMDDYVEGRFMSGDPKHVFLLGDTTTLPLKMMDGPTWYKNLHRITTLDTATVINDVGNVLKFSSRQWKWLAGIYELKIEDKNAERRQYGRWGAPGKEKDLSPNKLESVILPPAPIITDPVAPAKSVVPATKIEEPKAKVDPVKVDAPVVEKPAVPLTVTIKPEPVKVETKVEAPAPAKVEPVKVAPPQCCADPSQCVAPAVVEKTVAPVVAPVK